MLKYRGLQEGKATVETDLSTCKRPDGWAG